ncbi:DNA replication/repair protein RecF [bacterium]|nr:MAG: DNA replication/repair protein RecF [bacterium]RKZ16058.1 MAG: DNA replication/repair protein RecF [bacterium]
MRVERVKLHNFRNLRQITVDVSPRINILLGRNGQGKTNFLEALSYLALGRSFRTSRDRELIQFQQDFTRVSVQGRDARNEQFELSAALTRDGKKKLEVDGVPVQRHADLVGHLSVVRFDPDEVELAKGSPDHRRRFLDYTLSLCSAEYFRVLIEYRRATAQKNRLLKSRSSVPDAELDVWDSELVRCGVPLLAARAGTLGELEDLAREAYSDLAPGQGRLSLQMRGTVPIEDANEDPEDRNRIAEAFSAALVAGRGRERMMRHCLVGPHRDRLEVVLQDRSLRSYGSQGEQRTASIALKLAQGELLYERTQERPVVVLDDIFSELDRVRTEALQQRLQREHQLFIATARIDHVLALEDWDDLRVWVVRDGELIAVDHLDRPRLESLQEGSA